MGEDWGTIPFSDARFQRLIPHLEKSRENRLFAAKESFKMFIFLYLSHYISLPPAGFHYESYELAKEPRLLQLWPRGFGKSVIYSIAYPLWKLLCNPEELDLKWNKHDIFCISHTVSLAEKWLKHQKRELVENSRIKADFEPKQGEIWRNDEYELKGLGRVRAIGVGGQFRGEHPTDAILDDIEDREEARSESNREKLREWFYGDFLGALRLEEGKKVGVKIIGNCVHPMGLMQELAGKDWWVSKKYAVLMKDGVPSIDGDAAWPEYMDIEAILEQRNKVPESTFMAEFMNTPVVSENPIFSRNQLHPYEPGMIRDTAGNKITHREMLMVTALDPAISQRDGSDFSAITTWGVTFDDKPRVYCLEAKQGNWPSSRIITEMIVSYERFPGSIQIIETVGGFLALYQEYKERLTRDRLDIKVVNVQPQKDKGIRANAITPMFQKGWVYFDHTDRGQQALMEQMVLFDFTKRKHGRDDLVDSAIHALTYIDDWIRRRTRRLHAKKTPHILWTPTNPIYGGVSQVG